jgi:uncharacterized membrane protein
MTRPNVPFGETKMKQTSIYVVAVLIVCLLLTIRASTQSAQVVSIRNLAGEDRKLCVYDINDKVGIVPQRCFQMKKGEAVLWNRGNDKSNFMVKIFKPGILDEYLYTRRLPEDTARIIVGEGGRFGFGRTEPKTQPKRFFLKACNQQWEQRVDFVLGFETANGFWTKGWWNLEKGKCLNFPISETMKSNWGIEYGTMPKIHYYARITGENPLEWRGGESDYNLCINMVSVFEKKQFQINSSGNQEPLACNGENDKFVRFRKLDGSQTAIPAFSLTF